MEPVRILDDTETEFISSETSDHGFISANISFAMSQNLPPTAPESDSPGTRALLLEILTDEGVGTEVVS